MIYSVFLAELSTEWIVYIYAAELSTEKNVHV